MGMRTIDGPGEGKYVSTDEAARWLGISDTTFEKIARESGWLLPVRIRARVLWDWEDVFALSRILKAQGGALAKKSEKKSESPRGARKGPESPTEQSTDDAS